MGKRKRNKPHPQTEAETSRNDCRSPGNFLLIGSHVPRVITKKSWKEECMSLRIENEKLKEELQRYKDKPRRYQQIGENAHVQVGDNNIFVVLHQYEDKIKEDAKMMKSMEEEIKCLSTKITELTETHEKTDKRFNNAALTDFLQDLHQLADPKLASPVSSIANWFDLVKKITPEIMRLRESIENLSSYIDEPKLEFLKSLCTSQRHLSALSLDETQLTFGDSRHQCTRKTTSELNLNLHV